MNDITAIDDAIFHLRAALATAGPDRKWELENAELAIRDALGVVR